MTSMLAASQLDPMGALITEARADTTLAGLTGSRIRGFKPAQGDAMGAGSYQAFVVFSALSVPPHPRVPVTFAEYGVACYGTTPQNAWAVWAALVKVFHGTTPRVKTNGLGIYRTSISEGGQQDRDPDTQQPLVRGTIRLIATLQSVTA